MAGLEAVPLPVSVSAGAEGRAEIAEGGAGIAEGGVAAAAASAEVGVAGADGGTGIAETTSVLAECPLGGAMSPGVGCLVLPRPNKSAAPPSNSNSPSTPPMSHGVRDAVGIISSESPLGAELAWLLRSTVWSVLSTCVNPLANSPESEGVTRGSECWTGGA